MPLDDARKHAPDFNDAFGKVFVRRLVDESEIVCEKELVFEFDSEASGNANSGGVGFAIITATAISDFRRNVDGATSQTKYESEVFS